MAIINAFAEISNVNNGTAGISITQTNENHTFPAGSNGAITNGDLGMFINIISVFVGTTQYTYTTGTAAAGEFSIGTLLPTPSGADLTLPAPTVVNTRDARMVITSGTGSAGFQDDDTINSVAITIPITINISGTNTVVNKTVTLSKSIGGSAPLVLTLANTNTVRFNNDGTINRTTNIIFTASSENIESGSFAWTSGFNGASPTTAVDDSADGVSITTTGSGADLVSTLTFTPTAWNTFAGVNDNVTIRSTRDSRVDQQTVSRLQDAANGTNVDVRLFVTAGSPQFIDGTGSVTYRADVYTNGVEDSTTLHNTYEYTWFIDGSSVSTGTGSSFRTLTRSTVTANSDLVRVQVDTNP